MRCSVYRFTNIVMLLLLGSITQTTAADMSMLRGVHPTLAAKARSIVAICGSTIISGVRHTRIRGTNRMSLHASGRAVDISGNPKCIYKQLKNWPGGYTTDYYRVKHVHISYGGNEHGMRFKH